MDTSTLAQMRTYLEEITHTANDATFPGSAYELQLLNKAYMKTAYKYDWPQTLKRFFDAITANVDRYALQSGFRKFKFLYSRGQKLGKTEMEFIVNTFGKYAVTLDSNEYLIGQQPSSATPIYNIQGSIVAGAAVTLTLDTVDGISAGDEIYISDGATSEFTKVQSVGTLNLVCKIVNSHTGVPLYRTVDGNYGQIQKTVTLLSGASDVPVLPGETHLIIPHYAASLYYKDIQEDDEATSHMATWLNDIDEAWLAFDKLSAGEAGQFTL